MNAIHPITKITCSDFNETFVPMCLSKGLVGITPRPNPLLQSKVVMGGFVFSHSKFEAENFALAPYPFGMTKEYQSQHYGSYITTFGSLLQSTLLGFTGLRIREGSWIKYPATLPQGWKRIEVNRIWIKGKAMKLIAKNGKKARLIPY